MEKIYCKVGEIEDRLDELFENDVNVNETELTNEEIDEGIILALEILINIPAMNVSVREGTFCNFDEESGEYFPDFSLTLIYEVNERDPNKFLYWEQDSVVISLYNFLNGKGYSMEDIRNADCVIEYEEC